MPKGPSSAPGLEIVRCVRCKKLRGDFVPVSECMAAKCIPAPIVSGRTLYCNYVFTPVGEEYGSDKERIGRW